MASVILFVVTFLIVFATITFGPVLFLRWIGGGRNPTLAILQPVNTTCLILTKQNTEDLDKDGNPIRVNNDGGNFVAIKHTVEGKELDKMGSPDPMNWKLVDRADSRRSVLYSWFGIQIIGIFRYVKINSVRKTRWGRKDTDKEYSLQPKTEHTLYPDFSGQHDIRMEGVETGKALKFNLRLNLTVEETYPYKVRMRVADAYAQFTIMVNNHVVDKMGGIDPSKFIADKKGGAKDGLKKDLIAHLESDEVRSRIEDEVGLTIRKASLPEFDFDEETRKLLEAATKAELEGEADFKRARLAKKARLQEIEAEAKYVKDVILPTAKDEKTVSVHWSQTMREQKALHTLVVGQGAHTMLPLPTTSGETEDKAEKPKS